MMRAARCLMAVLALGCGGRSVESDPTGVAPPDQTTPTQSPSTQIPVHGRLATYGASGIGIALYAPNLSASSQPAAVIEGAWQTDACESLAFDSVGNVYALCYQAGPSEPPSQINVFAPSASADSAPSRVITGSNTVLGAYAGNIVLDKQDNIYVIQDDVCATPPCPGMVLIFPPGASGNVAPTRVIRGPHAKLNFAAGIAVDAAGQIYIGNAEGSPILVFAADAHDDAAPIRRVGSVNDVGDVVSMTVDAAGRLYVADAIPGNGVVIYGPSAAEGDAPERIISGPLTGLSAPHGVAVDADGRIIVSEEHGLENPGTLSVFSPSASGNVAPDAVLSGVMGGGIAVAP